MAQSTRARWVEGLAISLLAGIILIPAGTHLWWGPQLESGDPDPALAQQQQRTGSFTVDELKTGNCLSSVDRKLQRQQVIKCDQTHLA